MLTMLCLYVNSKVYMACNFNCDRKLEDFQGTVSHVLCNSDNVAETVQDRDVVIADH